MSLDVITLALAKSYTDQHGGSGVDPNDIAKAVADYLAAHPIEETDPTVPEWAKAKTKPTYSAAEVGAIAQSDLQAATDAALAQAKASGEFDGPRGPAGAPGKNDTDGHTPVKGTDYWTAADKAEIVDDTKNAIDLSSYAKLSDLAPLTGTTDELTPTQVYEAVSEGIPVKVQYADTTYGLLSFTAFNVAESLNVIVSQTIVYYNGVYILAELVGNKSENAWDSNSTMLAQKTDVPDIPSTLPNPYALIIKIGSTTVTYDGSTAQTVTIDDGTEVSY